MMSAPRCESLPAWVRKIGCRVGRLVASKRQSEPPRRQTSDAGAAQIKSERRSSSLRWAQRLELKPLIAISCCAASFAGAQPVNNDEADRFSRDMGHVFHWVKVPTALLKQCATLYPDAVPQARVELSKWAREHAAFNGAVAETYERFKPRFAKLAGTSVDQAEANIVVVTEAQAGHFMRTFTSDQASRGCHHFELLLKTIEVSQSSAESARNDLETHFRSWTTQP